MRVIIKIETFCFSIHKAYDQDDWDSDFEDEDAMAPGGTAHGGSSGMGGSSLLPPKNTAHSGSSGDLNSVGRKSSVAATAVSSKTSFNRFSTFVKSGGENYILGKLNAKVQEADIIQVVVRYSIMYFETIKSSMKLANEGFMQMS